MQETWLAVLAGLDRFEGRASLKTWVFRIVVNRARTMAVRESRLVPSSLLAAEEDADDLERLAAAAVSGWSSPEDEVLSAELRGRIEAAIDALPARQRQVMVLRDVEGWSAEEVCNALEISETNQRVLLHRARVKVRDALADYLAATKG